MATIIELSPHLARTDGARASKPSFTGMAEIIIFPGVRYERYADAAPQIRRMRDTIEISEA